MKEININTQSSIKIGNIYFDPFKIEEESHDASIIFITHSHYDHFDLESIKKVKNNNTIIVIPDDDEIKSKLDNYREFLPNITYVINELIIDTIPSYNINKPFHPKDNNWLGYLVTINNVSYYIAGDTDKTNETEKIKCDIALVPIGGHFTMDVNEAADLIRIINPSVVIPTHYGSIVGNTEDGKRFKDILSDTDIEVIEKLHFEK
jgi:L-ascorbate metabolism protein UlaG (beta-lactamase superfamily)